MTKMQFGASAVVLGVTIATKAHSYQYNGGNDDDLQVVRGGIIAGCSIYALGLYALSPHLDMIQKIGIANMFTGMCGFYFSDLHQFQLNKLPPQDTSRVGYVFMVVSTAFWLLGWYLVLPRDRR